MLHITLPTCSVVLGSRIGPTKLILMCAGGSKRGPVSKQKKVKLLVKVHADRATLEDFMAISGIGPKIARSLVNYRNQLDRCMRKDDLRQCDYVGPAREKTLLENVEFAE